MDSNELPEGVTITPGITVMIEDLTVVPPLRAYGNSEAEALAAYEYQSELRSRQDAEDRGPVVAEGTKSALPGGPETEVENPEAEDQPEGSDLTPGQDAPPDNPI